jgi:hypothetical protein
VEGQNTQPPDVGSPGYSGQVFRSMPVGFDLDNGLDGDDFRIIVNDNDFSCGDKCGDKGSSNVVKCDDSFVDEFFACSVEEQDIGEYRVILKLKKPLTSLDGPSYSFNLIVSVSISV